jgi:hypothetical protein
MSVTLGCGEWQFIIRKNVGNTDKLPVWCQILTMLTFQQPQRTVFLLLGLTWTVSGWFNSKIITQKYTATIHKPECIVNHSKSRPTALWFINKTQQLSTETSLDRHWEHVQKRKSLTTRYQVMWKSLITDTETDVVHYVPKNFARVCKNINTLRACIASPRKDFCRFISPTLL